MSQDTLNSEAANKNQLTAKVIAQINEERMMKDFSAVQLSKFKLLDELCQEIKDAPESERQEVLNTLEENLNEAADSIVSRYMLGVLKASDENDDGPELLRTLLDAYSKAAKWTIVDHVADRILEVDEGNRFALRAKVESTERLRGKKELGPYLEKLATVDRKNPDIARKFALSILTEDTERALEFLKSACETYARIKDYRNLEDVWNLLVQHMYENLPFFERIERILVGNKEKTRIAAYLWTLAEPYKVEENWNVVITLMKKILEFDPQSQKARNDLVRAYKARYADHSLLAEFLKMSDIQNSKKTVGPTIESFERNIVFDKENYVYHRTRGVGKILTIDQEHMIIDFRDNPGQKMSIQMAISSLQPLEPNHIWVKNYENPEEVARIFSEDITEFFKLLLISFNNKVTLAEIKLEVVPRFLTMEEWSRWWSRARTQLKKDPGFGFNPRKKDELILREQPLTLSEEITMKFQAESDWHKKLDLALESLKDVEAEDALRTCMQFYKEQEASRDIIKKIHSHMFLEAAYQQNPEDRTPHLFTRDQMKELIKSESRAKLVQFCSDTQAADFKREIVSQVIKNRPDYPEILSEILYEVPIKVNRFVVSELNRLEQFDTLKAFLKKTFARYREHPEIFLWTAKSILTKQWNYDWIDYSREEIILLLFRLLKPLVQIEKKGTRMKNAALEAIFGTTNITVESIKNGVLPDVAEKADTGTLRRMAALFRDVPYIPDAHKDNFVSFLEEIRPNVMSESSSGLDEADEEGKEGSTEMNLFPPENVILVSPTGLEKRKAYLDHLINVEMPENSKEIGHAQEKGDLRENAEYKAAMERQATLRAEITRLDEEMKKAHIIDAATVREDYVTIGSRVQVRSSEDEVKAFSIFGPWEADPDQNIISYLSPLGKSLIGKVVGDEVTLESSIRYRVEKIENGLA